jgi:hypothetical protein
MSKIGNISDWKYILLDTSFIIDYLSNPDKLEKNPIKYENCILAKQIMDLLSLKKDDNRPVFYVSSITIGELKRLETQSITKKIISCFSCGDVTILPYGKSEAEILNKTVFDWKKEKQPNVTLKQLEEDCKKNGCANFRVWINDDMKILSCVKSLHDRKRLDVILTSDEKTFLPIATFMDLPCIVLKPDNFPKDLFGELTR